MNNPATFQDTGPASEVFLGREDELREIASFIKGNQSVAIIGPRGIGKTSLMLHLLRQETAAGLGLEGNLLVYLDCKTLSSCQQEEIMAAFCGGMAAALHQKDFAPEPVLNASAAAPSRIAFETALRALNHRGLRVVLLLDDFEQITSSPSVDLHFYNAMRSAAGRLRLSFLTSSERPLIELTCFQSSKEILSSPFFNIFSQMYLGLLPNAEARQLIRKRLETAGKMVSVQLEDLLFELVGGHPLALQAACSSALDRREDRDSLELRTFQALDGFYQGVWDSLSQAEQDMLRRLSDTPLQEDGSPARMRVLRDLTRKCLVVQANGLYRFPSKAWEDFILRSGEPRQSASPSRF